jgi:hypothetical protein
MPKKFSEFDTCANFIINATIGILPQVLAQVVPLGHKLHWKKFYEFDTYCQFYKTFQA